MLSGADLSELISKADLVVRPFSEELVRENGLEMRIGGELASMTRGSSTFDVATDDPQRFFAREEADMYVVHANEHILLHTIEYLELPQDIMGFLNLRSSFARLGLTIPPTIVDANFRGQLTIALTGGAFPVRLYCGDPVFHLVFAKLSSEAKPYSGRYQGQVGVTLPSFDSLEMRPK